jgi:hypothetical protein
MRVFYGKLPEQLGAPKVPPKEPVLYKQLPYSGLEDGEDNPLILDDAFWKFFDAARLRGSDMRRPLRLCFYSAGGGRAEMFFIEKLIQMNYPLGKVCLCDIAYSGKDSAIYKNLVTQMDKILRGKYKLLESNNALITETLREMEQDWRDPLQFKYDAIIAIHYMGLILSQVDKNLSPNDKSILEYAKAQMSELSTLRDMANIASIIKQTNIDSIFPQVIEIYTNGQSKLSIRMRESTITRDRYRGISMMPHVDQARHDQGYLQHVSPVLNQLHIEHAEFMEANPMFAIDSTFGLPPPQQGGHRHQYHHNRQMYRLL